MTLRVRASKPNKKPSAKRRAKKESAPAPVNDRHIGDQIRELRRARRMTLEQVSEAAGLSIGYLSQIERNKSELPIGTLRKICDVMGVHMSWFFPATASGLPEERDVVVRLRDRRCMSFTGIGINEELLSPNLAGPLELLMSTLEPGADSGEYSHDSSEAGVVIAGVLELWVKGRYFRLEAGDSFSFSSSDSHRCRNPGTVPTKVVWVITPPHY